MNTIKTIANYVVPRINLFEVERSAGSRGWLGIRSAVPSGLDPSVTCPPNVETLGYSRMSLRDSDGVFTNPSLTCSPSVEMLGCSRVSVRDSDGVFTALTLA
jgi:hypothetical protein